MMSVESALSAISEPLGLTVTDNRNQVLKSLNLIRSMMYSSYQSYAVAVDREQCITLQKFYECGHTCGQNYYIGITLPYDAVNIEGLKIYDQVVRRNSSRQPVESDFFEGWDVLTPTPTQTEIPSGTSGRLLFKGDCIADKGKKVTVKFLDCQGAAREETLTIGEKDETDLAASYITSIVFEPGKLEKVSLFYRQTGSNDCLLSQYHKQELVPTYKRIKFNSCEPTCPTQVRVVIARKFFEVSSDEELVETDSIFALREFAAYLFINNRMNNTPQDRQEATRHLAQATSAIVGDQRREDGESQSHVINIKSGIRRTSGLLSNRRIHRAW